MRPNAGLASGKRFVTLRIRVRVGLIDTGKRRTYTSSQNLRNGVRLDIIVLRSIYGYL